jgi:hypothetical protein
MPKTRKIQRRDPRGREEGTLEEEDLRGRDPEDIDDPDDPDEEETEDAFDSRGVLKDGASVTVGLQMRDSANSWRDDMHRTLVGKRMVHDGTKSPLGLHKPGFRFTTDAAARRTADAEIERAYRDYDLRDSEAWRGQDAAPAGSYPLSAGEGTTCTIDGHDGRLVRKSDWLVCQPTRRQDAVDARQSAYEQYDADMNNRWRGKGDNPKSRTDAQTVEDAYRQYDEDAANAWRGK